MAIGGRPEVLAGAADMMTRAADQLDRVRRDTGAPVRAAVGGWRGAAAQVATERLDRDLDVLRRAADACRRVAPALRVYAEYLHRAQADAAEGQRVITGADAVLGAGVVEIAAHRRAQADLEMGANIVRSAEDGVAAAAEDAARVVRDAAALLPDPVDVERGTVLDGLVKAGGDLVDEVGSTLAGALDHVNVFSDRVGETWSQTGATVAAAATDPMGAVGTVVDGVTAPIGDSYRTGGVDEAAGRTVGAIATALVGGKGLTKLGKVAPEAPPATDPGAMAHAMRRAPGGGLSRHEELGGHALAPLKAHVAATNDDLRARLDREPRLEKASTYTYRQIAERAIHDNIAGNRAAITAWLDNPGQQHLNGFPWDHGRMVGRTMFRSGEIVDVSHSVVVLARNPAAPLGYNVHTSFPDPPR